MSESAALLVAAARATAGPRDGGGGTVPPPGSFELLLCGAFAAMHAVCARGAEDYASAMSGAIDGIHAEFGVYACVLADGRHVCMLRGEIADVVSRDGKIDLGAGAAVPVALAIGDLIKAAAAVFSDAAAPQEVAVGPRSGPLGRARVAGVDGP